MITISIDGRSGEFQSGVTLKSAVDQLAENPAGVLGCMKGGVVYELTAQIDRPISLTSITYADDEGRRIYERSLRFLMLMAARHIWPEITIRIEHSFGPGLYITAVNHSVTADEL
ncbi:MAG: hypothetical protein II879_03370, partial [Clostridia bacterium]|nr:hypothetical protein [Clostridia bacterium]